MTKSETAPKNQKAPLKYQVVCDSLSAAIRRGEFKVGQRLPAERELATRFGISHMTARRAITDMVEHELLERRPGSGIYVRPQSQEKLLTHTLNLLCRPADGGPKNIFLRLGLQYAQSRGWRTRITSLYHGYERSIMRAIRSGEPTLILADNPESWSSLLPAMQESDGKAIVIGHCFDELGIPSVVADDRRAIRLAVEHLKKVGHRNIALFSNNPHTQIDRVQIETWRSCFRKGEAHVPDRVLDARLIVGGIKPFQCQIRESYRVIRAYLQRPNADATAIICLDAHMALGAVAACRDEKRNVPHGMSIVNSGDDATLQFAQTPITVIDIRLDQHTKFAIEMLEAAMRGELAPNDRLRLVQPRLIQRESVAAPNIEPLNAESLNAEPPSTTWHFATKISRAN